jgi:hypothetical protein
VIRSLSTIALLATLVLVPVRARGGSTEPALAVAAVTSSTNDGTVTLVVTGNYDHQDVVRLGYPVTVVLTSGGTVARLGLDGSVTVAVGGGAPAPVPSAPGVVSIAPDRLTAVVPAALATAGGATVRLEADFAGTPLHSNAVEMTW